MVRRNSLLDDVYPARSPKATSHEHTQELGSTCEEVVADPSIQMRLEREEIQRRSLEKSASRVMTSKAHVVGICIHRGSSFEMIADGTNNRYQSLRAQIHRTPMKVAVVKL